MASEPIWTSLRDDLHDALGTMSTANGFWIDYRGPEVGTASFELETDFSRPIVWCTWAGEIQQDAITGAGDATFRSRHYDVFAVSVAVKDEDGDHERRGNRIRADIHKVVLATDTSLGIARNRGNARTTTYDRGNAGWNPVYDGNEIVGGEVTVEVVIRWDHQTADMATA